MAGGTVGPFDWVIRFVVVWLLIFTFICVLLRPLWKLTESRPSLIIMFSRAIGNFLRLFGYMPPFIVSDIFNIPMTPNESYYMAYSYPLNAHYSITTISPHVHNLALAINRSHAVFFPFHYNMFFTKKRNVYLLCLCLWLICICVGGSNQYVQMLTNYNIWPVNELIKYSMYASGLCYFALGCRMLWMRYKSSSAVSSIFTEKDSIKILVVCFTCLAMSALNKLAFLPFVTYANTNFPDTLRLAVYWGSNITQWMTLFTEEICLALLVRDFRQNVKQQLQSFSCCCCRGNKIEPINSNANGIINNNNNNNNNATRRAPIRVAQVTRVHSSLMNITN